MQGVAWDPMGHYLVTQSNDRTCKVRDRGATVWAVGRGQRLHPTPFAILYPLAHHPLPTSALSSSSSSSCPRACQVYTPLPFQLTVPLPSPPARSQVYAPRAPAPPAAGKKAAPSAAAAAAVAAAAAAAAAGSGASPSFASCAAGIRDFVLQSTLSKRTMATPSAAVTTGGCEKLKSVPSRCEQCEGGGRAR